MTKQYVFERVGNLDKLLTMLPEGKKNTAKERLYFTNREVSAFLDKVLGAIPYATFKTNDPLELESVMANGIPGPDGQVWTQFFAYWRDQEGHAFLAPKRYGIKSLKQLGIATKLKKPADGPKTGKYLNRVFTIQPGTVDGSIPDPTWGAEVSWNERDQSALIQLNVPEEARRNNAKRDKPLSEEELQEEYLISVKYVDLDELDEEATAIADGMVAFSGKFVIATGLSEKPLLGQAWLVTLFTKRGLGKGHGVFIPHLEYDVVIYGPKTIVESDRFFFGTAGQLSDRMVPHTDRQAVINFGFHRYGLMLDLFIKFAQQVWKSSSNEFEFRKLFLKHTSDQSELDNEGWVLRRALLRGVSFNRYPGLFRRCVNYLMKRVMAAESRARIPMESTTYSVAKYAHVLGDPGAIGVDGVVDPSKSNIPAGCVVFPDLPAGTEVVVYRQPSENTNAFYFLKVVEGDPSYDLFKGKNICLLGRDAHKVLGRLGGGDMDDLFVVIHDPQWVAAFKTLRPYPETEKLSADSNSEEDSLFATDTSEAAMKHDELFERIKKEGSGEYTDEFVYLQIEMAKNQRAGIGPVVNYGMFDMLMSDPEQLQSMLNDINYKTEKGEEAYLWLRDREPFQAALFMTNLELIIDGNVKDRTLLNKLGDVAGTIRRFHRGCKVYPKSMANRIPASRVKAAKLDPEKDGFILARSLTCRTLEEIVNIQRMLEQRLIEREWEIVSVPDTTLRNMYPYEKELNVRLRGTWVPSEDPETGIKKMVRVEGDSQSLMDIWSGGFRDAAEAKVSVEIAYPVICEAIAKELQDETDDYMERLSVELYYQQYRAAKFSPRYDEKTGEMRGYPDGLLWSPIFANHFISALMKAKMTGYYYPATLRPEYKNRLSNITERVQLRGQNLYVRDNKDVFSVFVGWVDIDADITKQLHGAEFYMDGGVVEFLEAEDICKPKDAALMERRAVTRLYPPRPETPGVLESAKPKQATGVVGKALKGALDILKNAKK